ncbi:MAG: DUF479 domain-containing protein [Verrucomicrobia bacterium]|nr:DUF479 domain-containing protein [Verrucomicrobiota bacterium]
MGHIVLARDSAESRIGNFLGDFVKGLPSSFPEEYGAELVDGILMHRAVDVFTDAHPAFLRARALLAPERRRFAGIVVDIVFDHFLSLEWHALMGKGREGFIRGFYSEISSYRIPLVVDGFPAICERMIRQDWLGSYATLEGIELTIRRVSSRSTRLTPMIGASDDFEEHFDAFRDCFEEFFPDEEGFARQWQQKRSPESGFQDKA